MLEVWRPPERRQRHLGQAGPMVAGTGDDGVDMALLARRIAEVRVEYVRLLVLDAMVPGQRLVFDAPAALVETLRREQAAGGTIGMVGQQRRQLVSHGVEVAVERVNDSGADGGAEVSLRARRVFELRELGDDEGSRWLGRRAAVRWIEADVADDSQSAEACQDCRSFARPPCRIGTDSG